MACRQKVTTVFFDALGTLITPRHPIHVQYAEVFEPYLGKLEPSRVQGAFKKALKDVQREKPVFAGGAEAWWRDVIWRTAIGAGAPVQSLNKSLGAIVPRLMQRFSGSEGYKPFVDSVPTLETLRAAGVRIVMLSNGDPRMKTVFVDLGIAKYFDHMLVSEDLGNEKPARQVWVDACLHAGARLEETVHVGDELECDYKGARHAGVHALLVRRPGPDGNGEHKETDEVLTDVEIVRNLSEVVAWISQMNGR
ncbi:HAD hydrolase subfamily IA REG-2-like protein [Gautieria morchelliformis]|nr:HAD hydrolase subfamily IA REG-2-like protein [Gautieria morchelliformis]